MSIGRAGLSALMAVLLLMSPARAADDFTSLAAAIHEANRNGSGLIRLDHDIRLLDALPAITSDITIEGNGHSISGDQKFRIFDVDGGALTLRNASLTEGRAESGGAIRMRNDADVSIESSTLRGNIAETSGGAIHVDGGVIRIHNSRFEKNCAEIAAHDVYIKLEQPSIDRFIDNDGCPQTAYHWTSAEEINVDIDGRGGAISLMRGARLDLQSTVFAANKGTYGGAIASAGANSLEAGESSFESNYAHKDGGALHISGGTAAISQSSFLDNHSQSSGGAILSYDGQILVENSTFHSNRPGGPGDILANHRADATLTHITVMLSASPISSNSDAIHNYYGAVKLRNSIVVASGPRADCVGLTEAIGNLSQDGTCALLPGKDPMLGELTGAPAYFPLRDFSHAIDAADRAYCLAFDQVGQPRPQGGDCDIGAIESPSALPAPTPQEPPPPCPLALQIIAANTDAPAGGCPAGNGHDVISLTRDIELRAALPQITSQITIEGNGHTLDGGRKTRLFDVNGGALTIKNLTMFEGYETFSDGGALRLLNGGRATVHDSRFILNRAEEGGAIAIASPRSRLTIKNSHFEINRATQRGGAIAAIGGAIDLQDSSFVRNRAGSSGGAIDVRAENRLLATGSTFLRNRVTGTGGAIAVRELSQATLTQLSMLDNLSTSGHGNGVYVPGSDATHDSARITLRNSVIGGESGDGDECWGKLAQNIGNFIADGSCSPMLSGDPMLAKVSDSATFSSPLPGSPLIQRADPRFCTETDQLGNPRPQVGSCTIGAIEAPPERSDLAGCLVTTTHALNFRDGPGGQRIGSVPETTMFTAKARTPHWFQVEYAGDSGWISADYVKTEGSCA